jgi:hypothetical protein
MTSSVSCVGVHALHVLEVFEAVDEAKRLVRRLFVEVDRHLRDHREIRLLDLDPARLQRLTHFLELRGLGADLDDVLIDVDVLGAGVDGLERDLVGVAAVHGDSDEPLGIEQPRNRAVLPEVPASAAELVADPAMAVLAGEDRHEDRCAAGQPRTSSSNCSASAPAPVPLAMARSMLSLGMLLAFAR